ncbi:MAG: squalene--hopene cyclase [Puniceicoccaceae bacterium]
MSPETKPPPAAAAGSDRRSAPPPSRENRPEGLDFPLQARLLEKVSRTFALTIPELPPALRHVVGNAYLLCRILDTIEDEPEMEPDEKSSFFRRFRDWVVRGGEDPAFAEELAAKLGGRTPPAERELVRRSREMLRITRSFTKPQRQAIHRCVGIMSRGMEYFQHRRKSAEPGLRDLGEMSHYCYCVAGVVGEMLTDLFCAYSAEIEARRPRLAALAPGFGQGLQMTNILKDIHEDRKRRACWLPKDVFGGGAPLSAGPEAEINEDAAFQEGIRRLTGVAHNHLKQALEYTLCFPRHETGIRRFCLMALGMAVLTLRKIHANPSFSLGAEVKISRRSVKATVLAADLLARRDAWLRRLFAILAKPLPRVFEPSGNAPPAAAEDAAADAGSAAPRSGPPPDAAEAVRRAARALRGKQRPDGHWCYDFEADCTIPAEYILMTHFDGRRDPGLEAAMARYLLRRQGADGGWPLYQGGKADISCTVKAYYALKLAGIDPESEPMRQARFCALSMGGAARANVFTRITLAIFGQAPWRAVPFMPVEILLLPKWFPFHLGKVAYWSRTVMAPLLVLYSKRARAENPTGTGVAELFITPAEIERHYFPTRSRLNRLFLFLERSARLCEPLIPPPLRRRATRRAMGWVSDRLNGRHGLGAIFPAMVNAYEALIVAGAGASDPRRRVARQALDDLVVRRGDEAYCQPCVSPVWDTALAAAALQETGHADDREAASRGLEWLEKRQLLDEPGDWSEARPDLPGGGWPFQYENAFYPDLDDTALAAFVLWRQDPRRFGKAIARAARWLAGLQSRNGGFASFEVDNTHYYLNEIPFADHGALLDPPTADVSARCAMLFGAIRKDHPELGLDKPLARVLDYLRREQEDDGSWFGRWGTNHIYGTWSVLLALEQCPGAPAGARAKAAAWLLAHQRPDGSWGETNDSYEFPRLRGRNSHGTAFQTAWALLGLMAAGEGRSAAVERGVRWLLEKRNEDGLWNDPDFTCPGFPRVFYLKYHGYTDYFPLWALARYARENRPGAGGTPPGA